MHRFYIVKYTAINILSHWGPNAQFQISLQIHVNLNSAVPRQHKQLLYAIRTQMEFSNGERTFPNY